MKALVTGGAGFIGSHLAEHLLAEGHFVTVLDDLSTGRYENLAHLMDHPRMRFELGSVLDHEAVERAMEGADSVFHLAAAVGVELVVERPLEGIATNVRGSEIVMEHANLHRARVLVTSTSEIYGKNSSDSLSEDDDRILGSPLKRRWSYSEAGAGHLQGACADRVRSRGEPGRHHRQARRVRTRGPRGGVNARTRVDTDRAPTLPTRTAE